jgi:hypothetical protein
MKSETITFADLEKLLVNLGFVNLHNPKYQIFEHSRENARISLQNYAANDLLRPVDLVIARGTLEAHGLMSTAAFNGYAEKVPS